MTSGADGGGRAARETSTVARRSALYAGHVRHRRLEPGSNSFRYGVYQLLLDLDELSELAERIWLLGYNRPAITSFHDADHLGVGDRPIRRKLEDWLEARGVELGAGPVLLLTNLRVLGYVFNPVSYFYCMDEDGGLRFVVAEVNNTFGERYAYLLDDLEPLGGGALRSRRRKVFHVSPFIEMERISYDWIVTPPADHLVVHIDEYRDGSKFFDATLTLERRPLTSSSLARALLRYPHITARTIALIHWQAAKLWWKGVPVHRKPEPPPDALRAGAPLPAAGTSPPAEPIDAIPTTEKSGVVLEERSA